jgi:hypothetical protein
MNKPTTLALTLICVALALPAQGNGKEGGGKNFIVMGMGFNWYNSLAQGWTPLRYNGPAYLQTVGYHNMAENGMKQDILLRGIIGRISPADETEYNEPGGTLIAGDITYAIQWPLKVNIGPASLYLGGSFNSLSVMKTHDSYGNSAFNYEFINSFSALGSADCPFSLFGLDFSTGVSLSLPVFSVVIAPSYNYAAPEGFTEEKDFLPALGKSLKGQSFEDLFRLRTGLHLDWQLDNGNILRLQYNWDYFDYYYIPDNRVQTAFHMISFNTLFKL